MPSLFDMFRSGNQQPQNGTPQNGNQSQNNAPNPGNIPDPNNPVNRDSNANVNDPNSAANKKPAGDANTSPLADFASLWENPPAPKPGESIEPNWDDHSSIVPKMKIDPKRLIDSARRIDFSKAINPERVQKALKEGDVGAFNEVMNSALQAAFANQAMTMSRMAETMFGQMAEKLYTGALPHHLRKHTVNQTINSENPIFEDPAVAPMLDLAKQQFQVRFPKASAKEISEMAKNYVLKFAEAVTAGKNGNSGSKNGASQQGKTQNSAGDDNFDWVEFAGGGQQ